MAKKPMSYLAGSVLLGTAIGAVVGLLAAPLAGREMRARLRERATNLQNPPDSQAQGHHGLKPGIRLRDLPSRGTEALRQFPERGRVALRRFPAWLMGKRAKGPSAPDEAATNNSHADGQN